MVPFEETLDRLESSLLDSWTELWNEVSEKEPEVQWAFLSRRFLSQTNDFRVDLALFQWIYRNRSPKKAPAPAWRPEAGDIDASNLRSFMRELSFSTYNELWVWAAENRGPFWEKMASRLRVAFKTPYDRLFQSDGEGQDVTWFSGAKLNIVESCFNAAGSKVAVRYRSESGASRDLTYKQLNEQSSSFARGLREAGLGKGDCIAIDMPMTDLSVVAYLGILKAGAAVVSIADSFAPAEIKSRLEIAGAKAIVTQDYNVRAGKKLPLYEKVISADAPMAIVVSEGQETPKLRSKDVFWNDFLDPGPFESVSCLPSDPINILFSSGTTGDPKAIPWDHTTPIKAAADAYLHQDIHPSDVLAWPTNLGWMMGPWLIFASLMNRASMALYGGVPSGREFGEFVRDSQVTMLGVVPSIVKSWRKTDCMKGLDWSSIRLFSSTGECSNAEDYLFLMSLAGYRPVIEYCGGTEIGGGYLTGTVLQDASPGTFTSIAMGLDLTVLDESGKEADTGEVFLIPPSMGLSRKLLNRDHDKIYFEGTPKGPNNESLRRHGDEIEKLPGGYFRGQGRVDDTMNLGGVKVSSTEIETVLNKEPGVLETAAIATSGKGGGPSELVIFAVAECADVERIKKAFQKRIRDELNPLFKIRDLKFVSSLPRTASNKVMRRELRKQYQSR